MTGFRLGVIVVAIGIGLLLAGAIDDSDLMHIAAVGLIVLGATAICIATEDRDPA